MCQLPTVQLRLGLTHLCADVLNLLRQTCTSHENRALSVELYLSKQQRTLLPMAKANKCQEVHNDEVLNDGRVTGLQHTCPGHKECVRS